MHSSAAQSLNRIGGFSQYADALLPLRTDVPSAIYLPACELPFRSVNGQRFENLNPLFKWLTNSVPKGATIPERPMPDWIVVNGEVLAIKYERGMIIKRGRFMTGGYGDVFHVVNYPKQEKLVDGSEIFGVAKHVGTIQYHTLRGAIATVHSFDFGRPPTPEELAAVRARAPVVTKTVKTPQVTSNNYAITPPRP